MKNKVKNLKVSATALLLTGPIALSTLGGCFYSQSAQESKTSVAQYNVTDSGSEEYIN